MVDTVTSGNWIKRIKENVSSRIDLTKEPLIGYEVSFIPVSGLNQICHDIDRKWVSHV